MYTCDVVKMPRGRNLLITLVLEELYLHRELYTVHPLWPSPHPQFKSLRLHSSRLDLILSVDEQIFSGIFYA